MLFRSDGVGGHGIIAPNGAITIGETANIDTITGGNSTNSSGGRGIYSYSGTITIGGETGAISGGDGNISGGDGIYSDSGNITIDGTIGDITGGNGGIFGGSGIYSSSGDITISATVTVNGNITGNVTVNGTLINNGTITINVGKTITNNGTITNSDGGTITNNGTITNSASGTITNNGAITNTGTFINNGTINGTNIHTVTYNANGGSGDNQTVTLPNGVSQTVLASPFTRSGYSFNGWNTETDGTGDSYAAGAAISADTTLYAQWKRNSSGGGGGSATTQPTTKIDGVDVNYSIDNKGVVTLKPTPQQLDNLLKAIGDDGALNITVSGIANMKSAIIEIDLTKLIASDKLQVFVFNVLGHEVRFPVGALESMQKLAKTLRFGVAPGSIVFDLTDANGKRIDWYDYANPVTVSMPFTAPQDISTHQIVMTDKTDDAIVPRSWYADGSAYAKVSAPGTYDAAIKPLAAFTDTSGLWMAEAVGYMGARGIVEGIGDNLFDAQGVITRAHFVTMLMRALDVALDYEELMPPEDFADAPEWAKESIRMATALGITLCDEDGNFDPSVPILRKDMFFMAYEAMAACGMLPNQYTMQFVAFADWDDVETEHADAIQNLAKLKLVNGNGDGMLNPNGQSTRSEGAQFLNNILKYDAK